MAVKFSTSINITRDADREVKYIPTENSQRVFAQLFRDFDAGIRSFTIIGSYGTGKSAFLLAMQKTLQGTGNAFEKPAFGGFPRFNFLNLIGEYGSLIDAFAQVFKLDIGASPAEVIAAMDKRRKWCADRGLNFVIAIDEFGKFLEYAAKHDPDRELYFVQQVAEFVNDPEHSTMLISTLHQGFDSYANGLRREQRQEWIKVKGRFKEITFNEPVEQLLFLAAEQLASISVSGEIPLLNQLNTAIERARAFPLRTDSGIRGELSLRLYPMDLMSASSMAIALQRYGQNERSLFTFLESRDYLGLHEHARKRPGFYHLGSVYDYLIYNYFSFLSSRYNPDFTQWSAIRSSLERAEADFPEDFDEISKLIKSIGLLNLFASAAVRIDAHFLQSYGTIALGVRDVPAKLRALENKKLVRYIQHKEKFILFDGTDVDIEKSLIDAAEKVAMVTDIVPELKRYFTDPIFSAKAAHYKKGTPRNFRFKLSDAPIEEKPEGEIDGFVNLVFSGILDDDALRQHSANTQEAILFGRYNAFGKLRQELYEIAKIQYVIAMNQDDDVAVRELKALMADHKASINQCLFEAVYGGTKEVTWFFKGEEQEIRNRGDFQKLLSIICEKVYPDTPTYRMELINRHKLPSALSKARRSLMQAMQDNGREEDLGFPKKKFPPEKTVYLTLLKETGMHRPEGESYVFGAPDSEKGKGLAELWQHCEKFLDSARLSRKNLQDFFQMLSERPLKLKGGFLDVWVPVFMMIKKDDFALFEDEKFIPRITPETIDLVLKKPGNFWIKSFNVKGVRLDLFNQIRTMIQLESVPKAGQGSFIETIVPFLTFYKDLPSYTKKTKNLAKHTLAIRSAIEKAKDPEKTFFEDFPAALGFNALNLKEAEGFLGSYVEHLNQAIRELRESYDKLIERVEEGLLDAMGYEGMGFEEYKEAILQRYGSLRKVNMLNHQKNLHLRLLSPLDDRVSWISSIVQALIGKHLDQIADEEEELVLERFVQTMRELDNLCEISSIAFDAEKEDVLRIELQVPGEEVASQLIRMPRHHSDAIKVLEDRIEGMINHEHEMSMNMKLVALLNVLKKKLQHD